MDTEGAMDTANSGTSATSPWKHALAFDSTVSRGPRAWDRVPKNSFSRKGRKVWKRAEPKNLGNKTTNGTGAETDTAVVTHGAKRLRTKQLPAVSKQLLPTQEKQYTATVEDLAPKTPKRKVAKRQSLRSAMFRTNMESAKGTKVEDKLLILDDAAIDNGPDTSPANANKESPYNNQELSFDLENILVKDDVSKNDICNGKSAMVIVPRTNRYSLGGMQAAPRPKKSIRRKSEPVDSRTETTPKFTPLVPIPESQVQVQVPVLDDASDKLNNYPHISPKKVSPRKSPVKRLARRFSKRQSDVGPKGVGKASLSPQKRRSFGTGQSFAFNMGSLPTLEELREDGEKLAALQLRREFFQAVGPESQDEDEEEIIQPTENEEVTHEPEDDEAFSQDHDTQTQELDESSQDDTVRPMQQEEVVDIENNNDDTVRPMGHEEDVDTEKETDTEDEVAQQDQDEVLTQEQDSTEEATSDEQSETEEEGSIQTDEETQLPAVSDEILQMIKDGSNTGGDDNEELQQNDEAPNDLPELLIEGLAANGNDIENAVESVRRSLLYGPLDGMEGAYDVLDPFPAATPSSDIMSEDELGMSPSTPLMDDEMTVPVMSPAYRANTAHSPPPEFTARTNKLDDSSLDEDAEMTQDMTQEVTQDFTADLTNYDDPDVTMTATEVLPVEEPSQERSPDLAPKRTRSGARFSDDTSILKEFLNRAHARKAAQALEAFSAPAPPVVSPRRSPRKALAKLSNNSPSPTKPRSASKRPSTPPILKPSSRSLPGDDDNADDPLAHDPVAASPVPAKRRSTRSRGTPKSRNVDAALPPPPSTATAPTPTSALCLSSSSSSSSSSSNTLQSSSMPITSLIPLRRGEGSDTLQLLHLQRSAAQELASLTRTNTRRNKGASRMPKTMLETSLVGGVVSPVKKDRSAAAAAAAAADDTQSQNHSQSQSQSQTQGLRERRPRAAKEVAWDKKLVYYQEDLESATAAGGKKGASKTPRAAAPKTRVRTSSTTTATATSNSSASSSSSAGPAASVTVTPASSSTQSASASTSTSSSSGTELKTPRLRRSHVPTPARVSSTSTSGSGAAGADGAAKKIPGTPALAAKRRRARA